MEVGPGPGSHLALPAAAQPAPAGLLLKDQGVSRCASQLQKLTWHPYLALGVVHGTAPLHSLTSLVCGGQNQACDDADQPTDQLTVKPTGQGLHKASSEVIHGGHQASGSPMGTAQGRSEWPLPVLPLPREGASLRLRKSSCSCLGSPGTPRAQACTFSPSSGTCLGPSRIESASLGGRRLSKKWGGLLYQQDLWPPGWGVPRQQTAQAELNIIITRRGRHTCPCTHTPVCSCVCVRSVETTQGLQGSSWDSLNVAGTVSWPLACNSSLQPRLEDRGKKSKAGGRCVFMRIPLALPCPVTGHHSALLPAHRTEAGPPPFAFYLD